MECEASIQPKTSQLLRRSLFAGTDIAGASVSINLAGGAQGTFVYRGLPTPVTLAANTTYFILSQETAGGDLWYDFEATTAVTTGPTGPT